MHKTCLFAGSMFAEAYCKENFKVLDIGGIDLNGSLRGAFEEKGAKFICVDLDAHPSVDVVVKPGEKLPFEDGVFDLVVSTSCFEHDPCFWLTFKEMCRVTKLGGLIYVNAPSNGLHHEFPGDNWRFYRDAGQALAYWSGIVMGNEQVYPTAVEEVFFIEPYQDQWRDFVCVWKRTEEKQTSIVTSFETSSRVGLLKRLVQEKLRVSQTTPAE